MSVRHLKKKSQTDWDRVDRMTDEEIDTSDIPPLTDEFFKHAKVLLPRVYIDRLDLIEAREFAAYILEKRWPNKKDLAHDAFNTALIISYARPFGTRYDLELKRELPLDKQVVEVLNEKEEIALHERIKVIRDESFAHSDARSHLFENFDYNSKQVLFFKRELPLSKSETALLATMIQKWINYLDTQIEKIKESRSRVS